MAKNIALGINVKINGTQTAVKSIDELEQAIVGLEAELKTAEFGSQKFKQLTKEVGGLKAGLRDVQREAEGVDVTQEFELFASSVNGITGAFLVATSAIQAFGIEGKNAEELNKIQARALAAVNFALGIRAVLEARVKFGLLQKNIAEKASAAGTYLLTTAQSVYTTAVGASTGALKAFRIALATTGIGALVVGLGLLISKLFDYISSTEEAAEATKTLAEFQTESAQAAGAETLKIQQLSKVVKQSQIPLEDRIEAYKELQKLVPELAGYTLEEAENLGVLNKAIEDQIKLIQLRAQATALEGFLVEQEKQRIAAEQLAKAAKAQTDAIKEYAEIQTLANQILAGGGAATIQAAMAEAELVVQRRKGNQATKESNTLEGQLLTLQTKISELQGNINGRIKTRTDNTKLLTDAEKAFNEQLKIQQKILSDLTTELGKYVLEGEISVKVLEDANDIIEQQNALLAKRRDAIGSDAEATKEYAEELKSLFGGLEIPESLPVNIRDTFKEIFDNVEEFRQSTDNLAEVQKRLFDEIGSKGLELYKDINSENKEGLAILENMTDEEKKQLGISTLRNNIGDKSLTILLDYYQTSIDIVGTIKNWNLEVDKVNAAYVKAGETTVIQKTNTTEILDLQNKINEIQVNQLNNLKTESEIQSEILLLVSNKLFPAKALKDLSTEELDLVNQTSKALREQSKLYVGISNVQRELNGLVEEITKNSKLQTDALSDTKGIKAYIEANKDKIGEIEEFFSKIKEDSTQLTEDQIGEVDKLIQGIKLDEFVNKIEGIARKVVEIYGSISSAISGIVSANNSLLLEQLAYNEEVALATIGDSTEEARAEQIIAQKKFAKERFDIEKSARISELQFTLADTVASGAQSVISSYQSLGFPLGIPLAAIMAGIVAAQIGTVNSQINFTKSKQFVGRRGGLIEGNSHEMGGVDFGGGLNLEGGEFLMNRSAVGEFSDILSQMSTSTGGRPLAMDDSRIVEEIRKQNQRPIKTYVLDSDITEARKINSRLSEISRL